MRDNTMKDFRKSNKWVSFKKRMNASRETKEIVEYFELLESQIVAVEMMLHAIKKEEDDGK